MLGQRRRQWPNIKPAFAERLVSAGWEISSSAIIPVIVGDARFRTVFFSVIFFRIKLWAEVDNMGGAYILKKLKSRGVVSGFLSLVLFSVSIY